MLNRSEERKKIQVILSKINQSMADGLEETKILNL